METYADQSTGATPPQPGLSAAHAASGAENVNLIDVMIILAKRKKVIFWLPFVAGLLAVAYSLSLPNIYTATTKLLPPQQAQAGASALLAQLGGAGGLAGSLAGVKNPSEVYVGMLKSRTVADRVVAKFDLKAKFQTQSPEKAARILGGATVVTLGKDTMITVSFSNKDQQLVAQVANAYVHELQQLTKTLAVTEASQRRLFFERQLEAAKNKLAQVEIALKGAMDSGGVISVDSESLAILQTAARLKAQVSAKEIQLGSMRAFVTEQNPEYRRVVEELASLRSELAKLEGGRPEAAADGGKRGGLDNIQLMRDLKYHQMLYELLAKQYEAARLDEAKDSSLIQVLDPAVEPEFKSKPSRALIVLSATMVAFLGAIGWAFFAAARERPATPANAARWSELRKHLKWR